MPVLAVRNNNPGCVMGRCDLQYVDENGSVRRLRSVGRGRRFGTYATPYDGVVRMSLNLDWYYHKLGKRSVRDIIYTWAPPHENNTRNYMHNVCHALGVKPNERINLDDPHVKKTLMRAIARQEGAFTRGSRYTDDMFERAAHCHDMRYMTPQRMTSLYSSNATTSPEAAVENQPIEKPTWFARLFTSKGREQMSAYRRELQRQSMASVFNGMAAPEKPSWFARLFSSKARDQYLCYNAYQRQAAVYMSTFDGAGLSPIETGSEVMTAPSGHAFASAQCITNGVPERRGVGKSGVARA